MINDEIIHAYGSLLMNEINSRGGKKILVLSIWIMSNLLHRTCSFAMYDHKAIERWLKHRNFLEYDKIYMPIHVPGHFVGTEIDRQKDSERISFVDSAGSNHPADFLSASFRLYKDQFKIRMNRDMTEEELSSWELRQIESPQQISLNCGVHLLLNIQLRAQGLILEYSDDDIDEFRYCIADAILTGAIGRTPADVEVGGLGHSGQNAGKEGQSTGGSSSSSSSAGNGGGSGLKHEVETFQTPTATTVLCRGRGGVERIQIQPAIDMISQMKTVLGFALSDVKVYKAQRSDWYIQLSPSNRKSEEGMLNSNLIAGEDEITVVDAAGKLQPRTHWLPANEELRAEYCGLRIMKGEGTVSYTHLTLPTIYSV